jgi:hypothetical protein
MIPPNEQIYRAIIAMNKQQDTNWVLFTNWLKDTYITEGLNTNEIDDKEFARLSQGSVRQLRQLLHYINNGEELLKRTLEAQAKADAQ